MMKPLILITLLLIYAQSSTINQQKSLAVTIYNNNFAMIKDVRSINFDQGNSLLYFTDVSSRIQTETVTFKPLNITAKIRVFQQNFENNLINKNSLLQKFIEKEIKLFVKLGDQVKLVKGILLGYDNGYILKTSSGIDVFNNVQSIEFPELPEGFFTVPTLNWKVNSETQTTTDCEVAYRTTGFKWKSDYSITLSEDEKVADIGGWVTIDNNSGKKYVNAKLKLIAGDVNTVTPAPIALPMMEFSKVGIAYAAPAAPSFAEKSFADYHMYTLSEPVTLTESSQKQVEFIPKVYNVPVRKYHLVNVNVGGYSSNNLKAQNKIQFKNSKDLNLGIPLPKGTVRVFKRDNDDGSLQFVGEDSINHTPKDENISLSTGTAFDLVINVNAESRESFTNGGYKAKMNMTISNRKDIPVDVEVVMGNYYGENLKLTWNSQGSQLLKSSASEFKLNLSVLGAGETWTGKWEENYYP